MQRRFGQFANTMGTNCCKCDREPEEEETKDDELRQTQVCVQCEENPEGRDAVVIADLKEFPINIVSEDLAKAHKQQLISED